MAPLTFADTHNMVVFLSKSDASDGFDQIVDFLNAHTINVFVPRGLHGMSLAVPWHLLSSAWLQVESSTSPNIYLTAWLGMWTVQDQPTTPHESFMPLLTTLMKTYATLSQKVAELEKDKHSQALEILQLKKRVKRLERKKKSKPSGLKRLRRVGTAQRVESFIDTILGAQEDASKQGGIAAIDADEGIWWMWRLMKR
uniref:Uncharacterized protein n=1 Tax=Tanacetum cinerariifolium TaxID=118510 RepID=A0A699K388_TANCI|nr:hypothetical protein [Tanacetum cinerariifolium]